MQGSLPSHMYAPKNGMWVLRNSKKHFIFCMEISFLCLVCVVPSPRTVDSVLQSCQRLPKMVLFSCSAIFTGHCRICARMDMCVLPVLVCARESSERMYKIPVLSLFPQFQPQCWRQNMPREIMVKEIFVCLLKSSSFVFSEINSIIQQCEGEERVHVSMGELCVSDSPCCCCVYLFYL